MKILIDIRLLGKGRSSGIEEYTRLLIDNILGLDRENSYDLFYNGWQKAPLPAAWLQKKNVRLIDRHIPNKLLDLSLKFFGFPDIGKMSDAKVIFSPHFNLLRTRENAKRIITFHDLSFIHYPEFYPPRKHFWHWLQSYKEQARAAAKIVAVSEFTRYDLIKTLGLEPAKIQVIHSGVNPFYAKLAPTDPGLALFKKERRISGPLLLFVGMVEPRKNITALIRAFDSLKRGLANKHLQLVVAGEYGWLYRKILKARDESLHAKDIRFWGRATNEELRYLYNLATVFVYPSIFEGFGFPPLEAQACGAPVIASNRSSLPEILGNSALMINPLREGELRDAISAFLKEPELRETYIRKGSQNVRRFSWTKSAGELIKLLEHA